MQFTAIKLKAFYLILITSIFCSCISKIEIPKDVLSKEEMAKCMAALLKAEDITRNKGLQKDSSTILFLGHYKPYELEQLGYTVEKFDSSYNFYVKNCEYLEEVMAICKKSLELKVDSLQKKP